MRPFQCKRQGVASVWLLTIMAFAAAVTVLIGNELVQSRAQGRRRTSELRAEWLARGGLELGMRSAGDGTQAGSIPLPPDLMSNSTGSVSWKPATMGNLHVSAETTSGEIPDRITRRLSVLAKRQGNTWVISAPIEHNTSLKK